MRFKQAREISTPVAVLLLGIFACLPVFSRTEELSDAKMLAQNTALKDLSGEHPFVLRQNWWKGIIEPGRAKLIQIQLFKRNEYRFWLAVPGRNAKVRLHLYDDTGNLVETKHVEYPAGNIASTFISVKATGIYYVRIYLSREIDTPQEWALIYGYR